MNNNDAIAGENLIEVVFEPDGNKVRLTPGFNIFQAACTAGNKIRFECGGKGICGKCRVIVKNEKSLTKLTKKEKNHLSQSEIDSGYRLACQANLMRNAVVVIPSESRIETRKIQIIGFERSVSIEPFIEKFHIVIPKPTLSDVRPDFERVTESVFKVYGLEHLDIEYDVVKELPNILRKADWDVSVTTWNRKKIIDVEAGNTSNHIFGLAIDVGTSKIVVYVVSLVTGEIRGVGFIENPQIMYGEDLITRIFFTMDNNGGLKTLQELAANGINEALKTAVREANVDPEDIYEAVIVGNTAMHHFLLGIEPRFISTSPFVPALKIPLNVGARSLNIGMNRSGIVHVLPIIAGFVGADAVADVLSSGIIESGDLSLLLDIGTNTEIFVGNREDILSCSCASGPAFEGGHIKHGMKAVTGAIEKIMINPESDEVEYETIGDVKPRGLCGSAIIDVAAEMFRCGIINDKGRLLLDEENPRIRVTNGNAEFVLVSKEESATGCDIVITQKDVSEIQLAKAAIYAGCSILMKRKSVRDIDLTHILIAGAFGSYLNPENAKMIGMMPDLPIKKIELIGNTAISGAKMALISKGTRDLSEEISRRVRYLELSIDPEFKSEYTSALFIPNKDLSRFPSIKEELSTRKTK